MENGDIVTACSDGIVRIWTIHQDYFADQLELDLYTSQLSQYKSSRYGFLLALIMFLLDLISFFSSHCEFLNHGIQFENISFICPW